MPLQSKFKEHNIIYTSDFNPDVLQNGKPSESYVHYRILAVEDNPDYQHIIVKFLTNSPTDFNSISLDEMGKYSGKLYMMDIRGNEVSNLTYVNGEVYAEEHKKNRGMAIVYPTNCITETTYHYIDWYQNTSSGYIFLDSEFVGTTTSTLCTGTASGGDSGSGSSGSSGTGNTQVNLHKPVKIEDDQQAIINVICPQSFKFTQVGNGLVAQVMDINMIFTVLRGPIYNPQLLRVSTFIGSLCITVSGSTDKDLMKNIFTEAWYQADQQILYDMINGASYTYLQANKKFLSYLERHLNYSPFISGTSLTSSCLGANVTPQKALYATSLDKCN